MKKFFSLLSFIFLTILSNAQAPEPEWTKYFVSSPSYNRNVSRKAIADSMGNVYTIGWFGGTIDLDPGAGTYNLSVGGYYEVYISKLDVDGNFVWGKSIRNTTTSAQEDAYDITLDPIGNIYITGEFLDTADFDPGPGVYNLYAPAAESGYSSFILKLNTAGDFIWAKNTEGVGSAYGRAISLDAAGNIYAAGDFGGTVDFDSGPGVANLYGGTRENVYILKLNSSGNFLWAKNVTEGNFGASETHSISRDVGGNLYITGAFVDTVDFDGGAGTLNFMANGGGIATPDLFVAKIDSLGGLVWAKQIGGAASDLSLSISIDSSDNVYTTGLFGGTVDFDPNAGITNLTSSGGSDIYILKLDVSGNFVWAKQIGGASTDQGASVVIDKSGKLNITGFFQGAVDLDPGPATKNVTSTGYSDVCAIGLDQSGNFLWGESILVGVSSSSDDFSLTVSSDPFDNIYIAGYSVPGTGSNGFIQKINILTVWPGDADHNNVVDNSDLLQVGLFYAQGGPGRLGGSNLWQASYAKNWPFLESDGITNIKHTDCNGNGFIDSNDTLAINLNFSLTHAYAPIINDERMVAPDLHFVTSSGTYASGSMVDVEVWAGTSTLPVSNLYGLAFTINYDASFVQSASESLTYPSSWLGTPGTDAIKIGKIDALATKAYGAETRIDHVNASGFGKIADFKFQLKSSIPSNTVMHFSTAGYSADNATGTSMVFNTPMDSIIINPSALGIDEVNSGAQISVYPNPSNGSFNLFISSPIKNGSVEVYNSLGKLVYNQKIASQQNSIDLKDLMNGLYFIKVMSDGKIVGVEKVVKE